MTKMKRALSFLLAVLMVAGLILVPVSADGESTGGDSSETTVSQPEWPAEGSIYLNKTAAAVKGVDKLWEVTLSIQGKNYKTTSDVVLVIDCSGSMDDDGDDGTKQDNTRTAAKAFGEKLLTKDSTTRIAIVTYAGDAEAYNRGHFYTSSELDAFKTAVDSATYASGGTNQQAGIHTAQELLSSEASTGKLKNIVILSDGEPTYSHPFTVTDANSAPAEPVPNYDYTIGSGGDFDIESIVLAGKKGNAGYISDNFLRTFTSVGSYTYDADGGFTFKKDVTTNNGVATIWEANQAKAAGTTIYSVALQAGTNGEATLKSCASDPTENKGYFAISSDESDVSGKLTAAFESIAGSLAIAASNGVVTDQMGDKVQLSFTGEAPVFINDKAVYDAGNANVYISKGTATYDATTRQISWKVGNVSEGEVITMIYRVTLREGETVENGEIVPTNNFANFDYKNYLDQETTKPFPVPNVTVDSGMIQKHYYMVNAAGEPINSKGEVVESPEQAKQVQEAAYFEVDGKAALTYDKEYTVPYDEVEGYTYYGSYNLNNGALTAGNAATVTLTASSSNQDVWFAYRQTFTVVWRGIDTTDMSVKTFDTQQYDVVDEFTLTDKVQDGYIYGGAFTDEDCINPAFDNGEAHTGFAPEAGKTYYIWQVKESYLIPKTFAVWWTNNGAQEVCQLFLMTPIDRAMYKEVGFVKGEDVLTSSTEYADVVSNVAYSYLEMTYARNASRTDRLYVKNGVLQQAYNYSGADLGQDDGYIAVCELNTFEQFKSEDFTFQPYWITMDGVHVTGAKTRACSYLGAGNRLIGVTDEGVDSVCTVSGAESQAMPAMLALQSFRIEMEPDAVEAVTLTVHDNGSVYTQSVDETLSYAGAEGKLFAGWFLDEDYTTPVDFESITESTDVYAKYVSDAYLQVKYNKLGLFRVSGVSLVSAVDDVDGYAETGILVNGEKVSVSYSKRYMLLFTASSLFDGASRDAQLMTAQLSLSGSGSLEVTPYWVTLDGTTVYGQSRTISYTARSIQG